MLAFSLPFTARLLQRFPLPHHVPQHLSFTSPLKLLWWRLPMTSGIESNPRTGQGRPGAADLPIFIWFPALQSEFLFPCSCFAFIKITIPMITHKQFLILHFLEGSDAANTTDQSLLGTCPSWVPCHHSLPSGHFFLAKLPSAQAFNAGFLTVLSHFSLYPVSWAGGRGGFHPYHGFNY